MALNPLDPALKILYGLDESGALSVRVNSGSWGTDLNLDAKDDNGDAEGVPAVSDDRGGQAADLTRSPGSPWTAARRWLQSQSSGIIDSSWSYAPLDPGSMAENDAFVMGVRFKWPGFITGTGGGTDTHHLWGCSRLDTLAEDLLLAIRPNSNTSPATGGKLRIELGNFGEDVGGGSWTSTGSPPTDYIDDDESWYRALVRFRKGSGSNGTIKVFLYKQSTNTVYTFERTSTTFAFTTAYKAATLRWVLGLGQSATDRRSNDGPVDEAFYYAGDLSDDELTDLVVDGIEIPWVAPDYERLPARVRVSYTNEASDFPPTRALPTGATAVDHPAGSFGTRMRVRYEGYEPNRPWAVQLAELRFDSAGRGTGRTNNRFIWDRFDQGLVRLPGRLAAGTMTDVRNMEFSGLGARRRRGFKIVRDTDSGRVTPAVNAFASFRNTANQLFRVTKVGSAVYADDGASMTSESTGFGSNDLPSFLSFLDRLAILTPLKRVMWDGVTMQNFDGEEAPTGGSLSLTTGTLSGTFGYAYTFYDPTSGDETAPKELGTASPSAQGVLLSGLDTAPTEARFTHQRIYRTVAGGASPDYFLTASQALATSYADNGDADGVIAIRHVNGTFTTLVPPESFDAGIVHAGRCFYFGGVNQDRVYRSEANTLNSFQADAYTAHSGPVRALASRGSQLVVFTDRTVELVESDWVRDANGATQERITVISTTVGCAGHRAVVDYADQIFWIDRSGAYRLDGDSVVKISAQVDNIFRFINWGLGRTIAGGYNPLREQIWWCVASAEFQDSSSLRQTQFVLQLPAAKWSLYNLDATYCGVYDDDLNGLKFGIIDSYGIWKEMESYESDGVDTVASKHSGTLTAVSGVTLTDTTQSWTTDEFRGMGVIVRDVTDGSLFYYTILSNTATALTVERSVSAVLAVSDEYYIGGIEAFFELSEAQMGTSNLKVARYLHTELDDLTRGHNL